MSKRTSFDIKKRILSNLKNSILTYAELERKVNTGFKTIKSNCEELEIYGLIEIKRVEKHSKNGKAYFQIKITDKGLDFLKGDLFNN